MDIHNPNVVGTITGGGGGATNKIEQGNSKVEVIDAGTGTISMVVDGATVLAVTDGNADITGVASIYYDNKTITPQWIFDVESNPTLGGGDYASFNGIRSYYHPDFSAAITDMRNIYAVQGIIVINDDNQTFDVTSSGQAIAGLYSAISITNSHSKWNSMKGLECHVNINNEGGVGTIGDVWGIDNRVQISSDYGGGVASWYGISNIMTFHPRSNADTPVWGIYNDIYFNGTFGGTNDAKGIEVALRSTTSTISKDLYGLHIQDVQASALTVTGDYYGIKVDIAAVGTVSGGQAYGLYINPPDMAGTNYGIYVNGTPENYIGGNLEVSADLQVETGLYFNDATADGSWRIVQSGDDLLIQQRESSTWVTKQTISGA